MQKKNAIAKSTRKKGTAKKLSYTVMPSVRPLKCNAQSTSDARLKTNIKAFPPVLEKVAELRPVHFNWRTEEFPDYQFEKGQMCGLIAQEVEKLFPEMVSRDARGYRRVDYSKLTFLLLGAIRELNAKIDLLSAQLGEPSREQEKLQEEMAGV